ncbi:hypothetical protein ScalyP_jg1396 [Parmales sp. scaly parma]|nr:hypothetical protein ScalyP_jg1396 [Parmales sp. scaly parma]
MKSRSILASINPSLDDEGLNAMLLEIDLSISEERSSYSNSNSNSGDNKLNGTPWSIFFSPPLFLKRMLVVGVLIASTQQLTGVDGVQYYMNFLLEASGITSQRSRFGVVILLGLCKLSAVVFAAPKIDSLGRRPMVLTSISGMIIGLFLLAIQLYSGIWVGLSIVGLLIFYVFFSVGLGPVCWLIPAEIFPNAIRAKAVAITTLCNRLSSTLIASTVLPISNAIGFGGWITMLVAINVLMYALNYQLLPETKNRSLEDMKKSFERDRGEESSGGENRRNFTYDFSQIPSSS